MKALIICLFVLTPLIISAQTLNPLNRTNGDRAERLYQISPFPIDTTLLDSASLVAFFQLALRPKGKADKYQISLDFFVAKDTVLWITEEGTNYGRSGTRQKSLRIFTRQMGTDLFQMDSRKIMGSTLYFMKGADPYVGREHSFQENSGCPQNCIQLLMPTDEDLDILNSTHLQLTKYEVIDDGKPQNGVQYSKLKPLGKYWRYRLFQNSSSQWTGLVLLQAFTASVRTEIMRKT